MGDDAGRRRGRRASSASCATTPTAATASSGSTYEAYEAEAVRVLARDRGRGAAPLAGGRAGRAAPPHRRAGARRSRRSRSSCRRPHRADAFEAARFCIDTLKETVPIWKQEHWSDGSDWASSGAAHPSRGRIRQVPSLKRRGGRRVEFLILAVVLIAIGVLIVVLRNRRPTGIDAGIDDFEARRQALAPKPTERARRTTTRSPLWLGTSRSTSAPRTRSSTRAGRGSSSTSRP